MLENRFKKFLVSPNTSPERVPASPTSKPLPPEPDLLVQPTRSGPYLSSGFQLVPVGSDDHLPGRTPQMSHSRGAQNRTSTREGCAHWSGQKGAGPQRVNGLADWRSIRHVRASHQQQN